MRTQATKREPGITTTATIFDRGAGLYKVVVIHQFDSGNFYRKEHENVSLVAAQGLLEFYTKED